MAIRTVGTGASLGYSTAAATVSSSFSVQSNVLRMYADDASCFVGINTGNAGAASTDFYIPANTHASIALERASTTAAGITTDTADEESNNSIIILPEGQQCPFNGGEYVTVTGANDSNCDTVLTHVKILSITSQFAPTGYTQSKLVVDANTLGIATAYTGNSYAQVRKSNNVTALGQGTGALYFQQVQITGEA